jgi:hypothetical protein
MISYKSGSGMSVKYVFLLLICISLLFSVQSYAQERGNDTIKVFKNETDSLQNLSTFVWQPCTAIFIELLGKGFLSLNVDFRRKESHAISVGLQPFEGLAPNIMYYHFSGKRHRLELGGGFSGAFTNDFSLGGILIHGVIGYRYQKKKGLFFRGGFTPFYVIFVNDPDRRNKIYPFAGLSLGYSF